jgi:hypothetical protein
VECGVEVDGYSSVVNPWRTHHHLELKTITMTYKYSLNSLMLLLSATIATS